MNSIQQMCDIVASEIETIFKKNLMNRSIDLDATNFDYRLTHTDDDTFTLITPNTKRVVIGLEVRKGEEDARFIQLGSKDMYGCVLYNWGMFGETLLNCIYKTLNTACTNIESMIINEIFQNDGGRDCFVMDVYENNGAIYVIYQVSSAPNSLHQSGDNDFVTDFVADFVAVETIPNSDEEWYVV